MVMSKKKILHTLLLVVLLGAGYWFVAPSGEETKVNETTRKEVSGTKSSGVYQSSGDTSLLRVVIPPSVDNDRVQYKAMVVYFNPTHHIPNCTAYELTSTMVAMADAPDAEQRSDYKFERDKKVRGCAEWWDYKNTPYDRGHMTPAMDMRWDATAMRQTFLLTNICPQDHDLNGGEWRKMEEAIHFWARREERLVVITGPILGKNPEVIGQDNHIAVPRSFFKVIYSPKRKQAMAFVFKNEPSATSWRSHVVKIDEVERLTGYDFFPTLNDEVENAIESRADFASWPRYVDRD